MVQSEYCYMTNLALFSAQGLSASRQTSINLFGWDCKPFSYWSPLPGVLVFPRAQREWEVLCLTLCWESVWIVRARIWQSLHEKNQRLPSCFSSVSSFWSGSLFRMISIPWVFVNKSLWQSFLPFVIHCVLCAVRPWFSKWFQDELKEAP